MKKRVFTSVGAGRGAVSGVAKHLYVLLLLLSSAVNAQNYNSPQQTEDYQDTEFGEHLYNEASVATRLEMLGLLSKDTPSVLVFLHAISMGLGIEDMLQAAVRYEPEKGRDFGQSAISLLPYLSDSEDYRYSGYELDDLERDDESEPYSIQEVADRFFQDRKVLEPRPDWHEGEYHFLASARELKQLAQKDTEVDWYLKKNTLPNADRPIFVSLYESDESILIDNDDRIQAAKPNSTLPVVFVYNRERERSIDRLAEVHDYPRTIRGVQQAYSEYALMLTPPPEWQESEYHINAEIEEIENIFDIPKEDDFEPEHWQKLLVQAEEYKKTEPAFLMVVLTGDEDQASNTGSLEQKQYAAYKDPRIEEAFPYVTARDGDDDDNNDQLTIEALMSQGLILNRPDLIAALKATDVTIVPIAFYYIDNARTKPYVYGPRALRLFVTGLLPNAPGTPGSGGGFRPPPGGGGGFGPPPQGCGSPPCSIQ